MAIKLKSTLRKIPWFLVIKTGLLTLFWVYAPFAVFAVVLAFFYLRAGVKVFQFWPLLLVFLGTLWFGDVFFHNFVPEISATFLFFTLFLLLGLKELFFIARREAYLLLQTVIFSGLAVVFSLDLSPMALYPRIFLYTAALLSLYGDFYAFMQDEPRHEGPFLAITSTFIMLQITLAYTHFPIGFLGIASGLICTFFFIAFFYFQYMKDHALGREALLGNAAIFLLGTLVILAFSTWTV